MKRACIWLLLGMPVLALGMSQSPDASFFKHAAEGGLAEVDAGNLAQSKGNSQAVKDFGAMMVKDHTAANAKLQAIASAQSVPLPTSASVMQMAKQKELDLLSGDTFDKSYIKDQLKDHRRTIALFKREIARGTDPQAKDFASSTLPVLQGHLRKIEQIAADDGVSTK
jgi:putative membrane protein